MFHQHAATLLDHALRTEGWLDRWSTRCRANPRAVRAAGVVEVRKQRSRAPPFRAPAHSLRGPARDSAIPPCLLPAQINHAAELAIPKPKKHIHGKRGTFDPSGKVTSPLPPSVRTGWQQTRSGLRRCVPVLLLTRSQHEWCQTTSQRAMQRRRRTGAPCPGTINCICESPGFHGVGAATFSGGDSPGIRQHHVIPRRKPLARNPQRSYILLAGFSGCTVNATRCTPASRARRNASRMSFRRCLGVETAAPSDAQLRCGRIHGRQTRADR